MRKHDDGTVDDLRHIALFARMTEAELARFASLGDRVEAEPGAVVIDQGAVGTECFLVLDGEAGIFHSGEHIATISAGSVVGEMALIGHKPRNATVIAETPMRLLSFNIKAFRRLLEEMPAAQKHIYEVLDARSAQNRTD